MYNKMVSSDHKYFGVYALRVIHIFVNVLSMNSNEVCNHLTFSYAMHSVCLLLSLHNNTFLCMIVSNHTLLVH